jgi:hypothetical protein
MVFMADEVFPSFLLLYVIPSVVGESRGNYVSLKVHFVNFLQQNCNCELGEQLQRQL